MDIQKIYLQLEKKINNYKIPLSEQKNVKTKDPFFILVAIILSSRTKDKITAKVCDKLFKKIKNTDDLINIDNKMLEKLIYPVGFYKKKAINLKNMALILKEKYNNKIPNTIEKLIELPGVGRKTANLVLSTAYNIPSICVDTHVQRIINRIGYISTKTPLETEIKLREKLPKKLWIKTNYLFVLLGQNICFPKNPNCNNCPINKLCLKKI